MRITTDHFPTLTLLNSLTVQVTQLRTRLSNTISGYRWVVSVISIESNYNRKCTKRVGYCCDRPDHVFLGMVVKHLEVWAGKAISSQGLAHCGWCHPGQLGVGGTRK